MQLFLVLVGCVVLLVAVRASRDRSYGVFTYRNPMRPPGDDRLGRSPGVQEDDEVTAMAAARRAPRRRGGPYRPMT